MKKKKWNRVLAVFLAMVMSVSLLSACGRNNDLGKRRQMPAF